MSGKNKQHFTKRQQNDKVTYSFQPLAYSLHGSDAVRVPGLAADISQQIAKYDSSEFDDDKEVAGGDAEGIKTEHLFVYPPSRLDFCFPRNLLIFPFISRATDRPEVPFFHVETSSNCT